MTLRGYFLLFRAGFRYGMLLRGKLGGQPVDIGQRARRVCTLCHREMMSAAGHWGF